MQRFRWCLRFILALVLVMSTTGAIVAAQSAPVELGTVASGQVAFQIVAVGDDRAGAVNARGYLTELAGLDRGALFTDPGAPSPATARVTFVLDVGTASSTPTGDATVQDGSGTLTIYLLENGGADPRKPASFATGTPVAGAEIVLQNVVQTIPPDLIVVAAEGAVTQTAAAPFTLDGEQYQLGHAGLQLHLTMTGSGTGDADATVIDLAGNATVVDEGAADSTTAPDAATPVTDASCAAVATWLAPSLARLDLAAALISAAPATLDPAIDATAIAAAATEVAGLTQGQRSTAVPPDADGANRLLVTTLSTIGRGLALLASAIEPSDSTRFDRGRQALDDGVALATRATTAISPIAASCGIDLGA